LFFFLLFDLILLVFLVVSDENFYDLFIFLKDLSRWLFIMSFLDLRLENIFWFCLLFFTRRILYNNWLKWRRGFLDWLPILKISVVSSVIAIALNFALSRWKRWERYDLLNNRLPW
jgi:hypothetical protein